MTLALMSDDSSTPPLVPSPRITRIEVLHSLPDAESIWRGLQGDEHLYTPFQRYDFLAAWQQHVGAREAVTPYIVAAFSRNGRPLLLLPLGVQSDNGVQVAAFLGGKHATFNRAVFERSVATPAARPDIEALLALLRRRADRPDLLSLARQPGAWEGLANPLALLPTQPAINGCPLLRLPPGSRPDERISNSMRKRLRSKERKLQTAAGYRYTIARSDADIRRILEAFFVVKPLRMAAQKLPDVFSEPGIREFVFEACLSRQSCGRTIDIHALECDDELIAVFAGVADGRRFSLMFNTYTVSERAKHSPGLILLRNIIDHCAENGYTELDLGIGTDDYKRLFCKDDEELFDSYLPLTVKGSLAALGLSSLGHAQRLVKRNPTLSQMAQLLRGALQR